MIHDVGLILASASPRRRQLLKAAGFQFEVQIAPFQEVISEKIGAKDVPKYLAIEKNNFYRKIYSNNTILCADTMVIFQDKVLGKPKNSSQAISMLESLSGNTHRVVTGVCISSPSLYASFSASTEVKMNKLTLSEISKYVENYHPTDKAGGYGIQDWIGLIGVDWIKGSFYNVMGLPIDKVYHTLIHTFKIKPTSSVV